MRSRRHDEADGEDVAELAALADGSLAPERRAALEARVAASSTLTDRLAEQQRALALVRDAAADVGAPAALRARVEPLRRPRRRPVGLRLVAVGSAVAVAAAVVVAVLLVHTGSSGVRFHAALAATDLAPGARGEATLTKTASGWQIEIDAPGLPRLDGGRFYEAWLKNAAGVLVPIGTFNDGEDVDLWAGVSPKDFPTLTVTREQADGNQSSSGERVLVGRARTGG